MVRPDVNRWVPDYRERQLSPDEADLIAHECEDLVRRGDRRPRDAILEDVLDAKVRCETCRHLVPDEPRAGVRDYVVRDRILRSHAPGCPNAGSGGGSRRFTFWRWLS